MKSFTEKDLAEILRKNPDLAVNQPGREPGEAKTIHYVHAGITVSERDIHKAVMAECNHRAVDDPVWGLIFHPANGELRHPGVAGILKAMGVKPGVPDLIWPIARQGFNGMGLELKRKGGKLTDHQKRWAEMLGMENWYVAIAYSYEEAIKVLDWYYKG